MRKHLVVIGCTGMTNGIPVYLPDVAVPTLMDKSPACDSQLMSSVDVHLIAYAGTAEEIKDSICKAVDEMFSKLEKAPPGTNYAVLPQGRIPKHEMPKLALGRNIVVVQQG